MGAPRIRTVIINATDPERVAAFWAGFLRVGVQEHDVGAGIIWLESSDDGGVNMGFQRVDDRTPATETHLDIEVDDLDAAQQAIESFGGTITTVNRLQSGFEWRVSADPDGNAFCIFTH